MAARVVYRCVGKNDYILLFLKDEELGLGRYRCKWSERGKRGLPKEVNRHQMRLLSWVSLMPHSSVILAVSSFGEPFLPFSLHLLLQLPSPSCNWYYYVKYLLLP